MPLRAFVALLLTLLLGPGAGHLYLRRFRKAILLIAVALVFALLLAVQAVRAGLSLAQGGDPMQLFTVFSQSHPRVMLYYDVVFAALWAYALVDAFFIARAEAPAAPQDTDEIPDDQDH